MNIEYIYNYLAKTQVGDVFIKVSDTSCYENGSPRNLLDMYKIVEVKIPALVSVKLFGLEKFKIRAKTLFGYEFDFMKEYLYELNHNKSATYQNVRLGGFSIEEAEELKNKLLEKNRIDQIKRRAVEEAEAQEKILRAEAEKQAAINGENVQNAAKNWFN